MNVWRAAKATGSVPVIFHFARVYVHTHTYVYVYNKYLARRCEIEIFRNGKSKGRVSRVDVAAVLN